MFTKFFLDNQAMHNQTHQHYHDIIKVLVPFKSAPIVEAEPLPTLVFLNSSLKPFVPYVNPPVVWNKNVIFCFTKISGV